MKLRRIALICAGLLGTQVYAANNQPSTTTLTTDQDKVSYAIGVDIGNNFKNQGIDVNADVLTQGLKDALTGKSLLMSQEDMDKTMQAFQGQLINKKQAEMVKLAELNQQTGDKFLADNKTKPGVITLASGLQYKVLQAGSGAKPTDKDSVTVEYTGRLINGKVFDSSVEHGGKVTFQVDQVIPGWQEALKLMPVGSTWEIYIPAKLAYGERGAGQLIGPNETLIFNLHLIDINKPAEADQAKPKAG
jgi:FKBP-type peptidyl-prolyl cis-trans isomerase FklB